MKILLYVGLILIFGSHSKENSSDDIIGVWKIESGLDIEFYKSGSKYCGKIVALNGFNNGQFFDINNPNIDHCKDSLIGKQIVSGLKYNQRSQSWTGGKMCAPHLGIFANLKILELKNDTILAEGSKYFFWHTEPWTKQ